MSEPRGMDLFAAADARPLHETGMMRMPEGVPEEAFADFAEWAQSPGHVVKVLYGDPEAGGMSLVWSWFAPHFVLPRHSHSADCLYYVTRGELRMGNRVVREGDGFFVPADAPYAYTAGPDGVQILEFRGQSTFDMQISESVARWGQVVEAVREHRDEWAGASEAFR